MPTRAPAKTKLTILQAGRLQRLPWLIHGFSTRGGGHSRLYGGNTLNLGFTKEDSKTAVERNRVDFLRDLGGKGNQSLALVTMRQVHSDVIHQVTALPDDPLVGDGIVTATAGLLLPCRLRTACR